MRSTEFIPNYLRNKGKSFDKNGKPKKSTREADAAEEERSALKISVKEVEKSLSKTAEGIKKKGRPKGSKNKAKQRVVRKLRKIAGLSRDADAPQNET